MGDMADFALEAVYDDEEYRGEYFSGRMCRQEAYERGIIDELGYEGRPFAISKSCRCCGKTGLSWMEHKGKWRLGKNGKLHECSINPLKETGDD
jgi:hypothetical protein